jgi:hypothetical protein
MKEGIIGKHIQSSIEKGTRNIENWKNFLGETQDPNNPLHDFAQSVISHTEGAIHHIDAIGIPQTAKYLTSVIETVQGLEENKSLSEKARILSEKYPEIPKFLSLTDYLPDQLAEILSDAGFLVMNYQQDPQCYDPKNIAGIKNIITETERKNRIIYQSLRM